MAVYGYSRVSTDRQAREGESLPVQGRRIEAFSQAMFGEPVAAMFIDGDDGRGVSRSVDFADRQEGGKLLALVKPGDRIISTEMSRCFGNSLDALNVQKVLRERRCGLHLLDILSGADVASEGGGGDLVFTIMSAVSADERRRIARRVKIVKEDQAARGRYLGGSVPFGYVVAWEHDDKGKRTGGALVECPAQQAAIAKMKALHAGKASLRAIAYAMRADGFNLSHVGVRDVLSRAA